MARSPDTAAPEEGVSQGLLRVLSAAAFVVFFQIFMVAPLIPRLMDELGGSPQLTGLVVPAYMIPYGVATLVYGLLSDRVGRRRLMLGSLVGMGLLTAGTATAQTIEQVIVWRLATGVGAAGVVPLSLSLIGATFRFERRGRPLGWLFAAMAGGMAFGAALGVLAEPFVGWRGVFAVVGLAGLALLAPLWPYREQLGDAPARARSSVRGLLAIFGALLRTPRGVRTYAYVFVNSMFHAGVYTWLGYYFAQRFDLDPVGIALAIAGYGVPGFVFGPWIGRAADRWGRRWIIPVGLAVGSAGAASFVPVADLLVANAAVIVLSLGYDLTQPLLAGIVTAVGGKQHAGQAMGLNVFLLFTGFGLGSLAFGELLRLGMAPALTTFALGELVLAGLAVWLFRAEHPAHRRAVETPTDSAASQS